MPRFAGPRQCSVLHLARGARALYWRRRYRIGKRGERYKYPCTKKCVSPKWPRVRDDIRHIATGSTMLLPPFRAGSAHVVQLRPIAGSHLPGTQLLLEGARKVLAPANERDHREPPTLITRKYHCAT